MLAGTLTVLTFFVALSPLQQIMEQYSEQEKFIPIHY